MQDAVFVKMTCLRIGREWNNCVLSVGMMDSRSFMILSIITKKKRNGSSSVRTSVSTIGTQDFTPNIDCDGREPENESNDYAPDEYWD